MPKLHGVHHRGKIIVAGGGVAALESLLALRALLGGTVEIELLAPDQEFVFRPIAVAEPFGLGEVRRIELAQVAADNGAHLRNGALKAVDAEAGIVRTERGEDLAYDFLVVAVGARQYQPIPGALTFGGSEDRDALAEMMTRAKHGSLNRVVFAAPPGSAWLLPLYELALFTSSWARQHEIPRLSLTLATYEARPLEAFGSAAGDAVSELLTEAGIRLLTERAAQRFDGRHLSFVGARAITADEVVTLPGLAGPALPGLPHDDGGFIPVDQHCAVNGLRQVYAAGDGTAFPIKQGGLAAQQADAAAEAIAGALGAIAQPRPFRPTLRGILLTGAEPRYLRARSADGDSEVSEVSFQPLWWPPGKIAGRHLAPYLASPDDPQLARPPLVDRSAPLEPEVTEEVREEEREAVALLLELADSNARRGAFEFAVKCLDAAEDVGGPLPAARHADRRAWVQHRLR